MSPLRRIYRAALGAAGIEVLGLAGGYLAQVGLARWLGASQYGVFTWVSTLALFLAIPCQLGLSALILRDVSPTAIARDPGQARGLLRRAYQIAIGLALVIVLLSVVLDRWVVVDSIYHGALAIGLAGLPFLVATALNGGAARAYGHVVIPQAVDRIGRPVLLLAGLGLALVLGVPPSAFWALAIFIAGLAVVAGVQYRYLSGVRPVDLCTAVPRYQGRAWLWAATPFALIAAIDAGMRQIDLVMIGLYLPAADVGRYAVASRLATLVTLSMVAINLLAASRYADLYQQRRLRAMQDMARHLAHAMFWPALVIALVLVALGPWLLGVFGPQFAPAYRPMLILCLGALVNVGAGSVGYLTNLTGHQWLGVRVQGAALVGNVALNALLIPLAGTIGAATATALSVAVANIALHRAISRRLAVRASILSALVSTFAARR